MKAELKRNWGKILVALIVVAVILLVVYEMFSEATIAVDIAKVTRGNLVVTIDGEGRTRSHDRFVVTAPISGKTTRIQLHEGDRVPGGLSFTEIDPSPPRTTEPMPEANRVNPYAQKVYTPTTGRISKIFEPNERFVQAGTPLIEISKSGRLEIVVDVLTTDATQIRTGALMLIHGFGGDKELRARVRTIEPQAFTKISSLGVEEQRVNVIADFLDSPESLGDAYRVGTRIIIWESDNVLRVPISALFRRGEKWNVFVIGNNRALLREIEIGHRTFDFAEVLSGLVEGETIIIHPPNQLRDQSPVTILTSQD
jgi:multidrug efflux pump subunit AcrA (membrane-fusion protein)